MFRGYSGSTLKTPGRLRGPDSLPGMETGLAKQILPVALFFGLPEILFLEIALLKGYEAF